MITIKDGDLTIVFDNAVEAAKYTAERRGYRKKTCKDGAPCEGDEYDQNHCAGCGKCVHAGMC